MKKEILRKWILSVGTIALATLPFVSVISCSNNNGGKQENPGGGDGGGTTPEPTPTKEILNHSNTFDYPKKDGVVDTPNLLLDFDSWKQKILNNQIKWFNDDGSAIIYEVNINIEPGLINSPSRYADVNAPQKIESVDGQRPENYWKQINSAINLKWEFWKKENNDSNKITDFGARVKSESPFGFGVFEDDNISAQMKFALPIDQNIAEAEAKGKDLENSTLDYISWLGINMTLIDGQINLSTILQDGDRQNNPWKTLKNKFNPIDGINTNLIVQGLPQSTNKWDGNGHYFSNVKGTLTIKPKQN